MTPNGNALRLLAYALAAVDHGSLRRAARAMRVRESSVSRNIVKLEQHLEVQLFERDVRGVRLTEPGRAWIDVVRAHYEGLLDAFDDRVGDKDAKTLRIGLCCVRGGEFLRGIIARFGSLYPDVSFSIEDVPAGRWLSAIRRRHLDLVFTHDFGAVPSCCSEVFWHERLFVLLPASHSLVDRPVVAWSDLAEMCLLVPVGPEGPLFDLRLLERIAATGSPAVQTCRANQATVALKVQLGEGFTLAEESCARTTAIESTMWKPLAGQNSVSSIRAVWLDSNPKRSVLRLVAVARNRAGDTPSNSETNAARPGRST
ncbi:LysR family transcriptional regulator [Mesorhizobium sp. M4B.F.Ca.ET.089.01.1.1]|uniref:LysR family transcriptional regulator n=1 Tax=Mesorhizobium sp. M4B.F.Ca.ET.089.01.1.1 TaxID=2496662 RepID=UPI000FE2D7CE|nr:LysR family transcriptional regulator [Mesorhizobium sp. M4B.F.Ca.ET.089.01.1.1]RWX71262.1 LysR family transcriptional regulator [Mesorhizobium sp. M4B.F.Ca.ET.089.01.1.1]